MSDGTEGGVFRRLIRNVSGRLHTVLMTEEERAILSFEETQTLDMAHHDEVERRRFGLSRSVGTLALRSLSQRPRNMDTIATAKDARAIPREL